MLNSHFIPPNTCCYQFFIIFYLSSFSFVYDCRYLLTRFTQAQVVHVYREGICCVDVLAKWGSNMLEGIVVFDRPSNDLLYLASRDEDGLVVNRVSVLDPNSAVS